MAKQNQRTECSVMDWGQFLVLLESLKKIGENKFLLFVAMGGFCGMRIGDIIHLKWEQIINKSEITLHEGKTGKFRKITLNNSLIEIINLVYSRLSIQHTIELNQFVFCNRNGVPYSRQHMNRRLHHFFLKFKIKVQNPSSHTLRKTFGRRVYEMNDRSEASLILLSSIFNHTSTAITRKYIGLSQEIIKDAYLNL